jgi:hypothetical protein
MKHFHIIYLLIFFMQLNRLNAQVAVNTDNALASPSAILDIKSTSKGVLTTRMTTTQRTSINTPAIGLLVFDTDTNSFWLYNGTAWEELAQGETKTQIADTDNQTKVVPQTTYIKFYINGSEKVNFQPINNRISLLDNAGNTFVGYQAGQSNTGSNNSLLGYQAGMSLTNGSQNSFMGAFAGKSQTTQSNNTYVGYASGMNQAAGSANTYLGAYAGSSKTGGDNNVFIGYEAGKNNGSGTGNVFIGHQAGKDETGSNKLYIDNSATTTPLIYGDFTTREITINGTITNTNWALHDHWISNDGTDKGIYLRQNNQRIGIGTNTPDNNISVEGDMYIGGTFNYLTFSDIIYYDRPVAMAGIHIEKDGSQDGGYPNSSYVSSVTKNSTGNFTINFVAGTFIEEPIVSATAFRDVTGDTYTAHLVSVSNSQVTLKVTDSAGNAADAGLLAIIVGEY